MFDSLILASSNRKVTGLTTSTKAANKTAGIITSPSTPRLKPAPIEKKNRIRKKSRRGFKLIAINWAIGLVVKPVTFRLGQISEFSLLIAYIATSIALIGERASVLIQATAILTFLASSYLVVFRYPTPIAVSDELRRD